ncbi:MAG: DUF2202 domain-containing protein [Alphaproteobacteria bacterium]|nr:DUF2202 domain-containing protein [Alphaproteobacteria bacterium]MBF0249232.1 DUF2202 domain-containing protein [Alphaproteobacteria bacterium]
MKPQNTPLGINAVVGFAVAVILLASGVLGVDALMHSGASVPHTISKQEIKDLRYMREEEKLARDVYMFLADRWGLPAFQRIAQAEQRHTDAIAALLDRYHIPDPARDKAPGVFVDAGLSALYAELVAKGSQSLDQALWVGGLIEEVDIHDLDKALANTQLLDISQVYQQIQAGSRNHLRAFVSNLENRGTPYRAQKLSPDRVRVIVTGPMERGPLFF